jgi:hypothetical protein
LKNLEKLRKNLEKLKKIDIDIYIYKFIIINYEISININIMATCGFNAVDSYNVQNCTMNPNPTWFEEPFLAITDCYPVKDILRQIIGEETPEVGNFPHNILEYIWGHKGCGDYIPWLLLCRLDSGSYAYYTAACCYTGFEACGGMALYVSNSLDTLVQMAMNDIERNAYVNSVNSANSAN